ncbi:MAG: hypothetical protein GY853_15010 [PVC group bacterium]|nr:hypothetical protein [PVC group bacterium]
METLFVAIAVAILSSYLTYYFTRKIRLDAEWRIDKLDHYNKLITSISNMSAPDYNYQLALNEFSLAMNATSLVAPQSVVDLLQEFQYDLKKLKSDDGVKVAKERIRQIILEIRKDLNISPKDNTDTFRFQFFAVRDKIKS